MLEGLQKRIYAMCLVLVCALCLAVIPAVGYAEDYEGGGGGSHNIGGSYPNFGTVWYDKTAVSNGLDVTPLRVRYGVVAFTNWDAAMYCLRGSSIDELNPTMKSKLLADSDFRTLANLFSVGKPEATNDWAGDASITLAWNSARELYGETYCYSAIYTMDQWYAADSAINRIKNEPDPPAGGGIPEADASGWYKVVLEQDQEPWGRLNETYYVVDNPKMSLDSQGKGTISGGSAGARINWSDTKYMVCYIDPYSYELFQDLMEDGGYELNNYVYSGITVYNLISNYSYEWFKLSSTGDYGINNNSGFVNRFLSYKSNNNNIYRVNGEVCVFFCSASKIWDFTLQPDGRNTDARRPYWSSEKTGSYVPPTEPPPTWPDPPTTPKEPPTVPEPPTPTPPTPWDPILPIGIDITGEDFQDLLDALDEHCKHLQKAIQDNVSQLWDLQSDLISSEFADLKDYLNELFNWLAERMNFNVNVTNGQYDDSSVVAWLKKIWSKMGDGINTQPTDPVQEPDDWWAWLLALMGNFVGMLLSFGSDKLGDVMNGLSSLTGKFPFSLPWDLLGLLAMLDAPPQIPEWDLPCFAVSLEGLQQVSSYHISLDQYDAVWENVRWIERLSFIVLLVRSTDMFTGMMRRAVGND